MVDIIGRCRGFTVLRLSTVVALLLVTGCGNIHPDPEKPEKVLHFLEANFSSNFDIDYIRKAPQDDFFLNNLDTMDSCKKVPKWLKYLNSSPVFSSCILAEFDRQLKPQFEDYFQRSMNWERLWLFVEPIPKEYYLKYFENKNGVKITNLKAELTFGQMYIDCVISWWSRTKNDYYVPYASNLPDDLEIKLTYIDENNPWKERYPGIEDKPKLTRLDLNTTFEVFIEGFHFSHEGYMEIYLSDIADEKEIDSILLESWNLWNNHEEVIGGAPDHRGIFHELGIEKRESNKLIYYLDCGSAIEGAHEFFMENLSKKTTGIEKVIFKPI